MLYIFVRKFLPGFPNVYSQRVTSYSAIIMNMTEGGGEEVAASD